MPGGSVSSQHGLEIKAPVEIRRKAVRDELDMKISTRNAGRKLETAAEEVQFRAKGARYDTFRPENTEQCSKTS